MKKEILILFCFCLCLKVNGQEMTKDTTECIFLKNINFKNGRDTVKLTALYRSNSRRNQELILRLLSQKKQLSFDEYFDKEFESGLLEFIPINCSKRYQATLSRKIYDRTYINKLSNIKDYRQDYVNLDDLEVYKKVDLTCIVFEQKETRSKSGSYFFTIIDLKL